MIARSYELFHVYCSDYLLKAPTEPISTAQQKWQNATSPAARGEEKKAWTPWQTQSEEDQAAQTSPIIPEELQGQETTYTIQLPL